MLCITAGLEPLVSNDNRQVLIAEIPGGKLTAAHFKLVEAPRPASVDGEVLLRVRYIVIDAAMRAWMLGPTYRAALTPGQVMAGAAVAEVIESRATGYDVGDLVYTDDAGCLLWSPVPAVDDAPGQRLRHRRPLLNTATEIGTRRIRRMPTARMRW